MMRVYATCFWEEDAALYEDLRKYGFGKAEWKDIQFVSKEPFDYVVIFTSPHKSCREFDLSKAVTFLTEPPAHLFHQKNPAIICPMYMPCPWWIHSSGDLMDSILEKKITKSSLFSAVTSELCYLEGHRKRLQFLYQLDRVIEEGIDIFGRKQSGEIFSNFTHYKGELSDKYDGLLPYRYHFACENSFVHNYFTEKILDPIIAGCVCFYDGCPNLAEYLDERAFVKIDVNNVSDTIELIVKSIEDNEYSKRKKIIEQQKKRILMDLNPLNIIWGQLAGKDMTHFLKL